MHPLFFAALITAAVVLIPALHRNRSTVIDSLTRRWQWGICVVLGAAWMAQFCDLVLYRPYEHSENIDTWHLLLIATTWATLTAMYARLRFTRSICFHSFGLVYFSVFVALATAMVGGIPNNLSAGVKWAVYVGCFVGTLVSAPYTAAFMLLSVVKRSWRIVRSSKPTP